MKYDGPFEIMHKVSPVAYRLRLPASYGIHPVINIAHLELYNKSPSEFGERPTQRFNRADFEDMPELEVEKIVGESWRRGSKGRRVKYYKIRFLGLGPEEDEWKTRQGLRNAPDLLAEWEQKRKDELHIESENIHTDHRDHGRLNPQGQRRTNSEATPATSTLTPPPIYP